MFVFQRTFFGSIVYCLAFTLAALLAQKDFFQPKVSTKNLEAVAFKRYIPAPSVQFQLKKLFPSRHFFVQLEESDCPQTFLASQGFTVLQFKGISDAVVVEHSTLPGLIIKFMRISKDINGNRAVSQISTRVLYAEKLRAIFHEKGYTYVDIPKKYFYCIDDISLVIAEKIAASRRTFKNLNAREISEILSCIADARGILDLKPKNMIITKHKIYFIDTERSEKIDWHTTKNFRSSLAHFKTLIKPSYVPLVEKWEKILNMEKN